MCGALVEDSKRASLQASVRALSRNLYPTLADKEIHWRDLDWERKEFIAVECSKLDFSWSAVAAYKPALKSRLNPPLLYNYCTRLLLERLCLEASRRNGLLIPVFSNRSRTNYKDLQKYVTSQVDAFGTAATCLKPIRTQQPNKERLLQLVDVCAGSLHNALEVNNFGNLQERFFRAMEPRLVRYKGKVWGCGLKMHPKEVGTDYGPATAWIDNIRGR